MGDTGSLGVHVAVLWLQVRHTTNLMSIIYRTSQPLVNTAAGLYTETSLMSGSNQWIQHTPTSHRNSSTLAALEWMLEKKHADGPRGWYEQILAGDTAVCMYVCMYGSNSL
jgi:hypothetical protein